MNKKIMLSLGLMSFLLVLTSFVSAFAVSSKYWEEYSLNLSAGETQEVLIFLQNMAGTENITVEGTITSGSEIARLLGDSNIYSIPLGQKTQISVLVSAPEDAVISQTYSVVLSFRVLQETGNSPLGIGSSIEKVIPIVIVPKVVSAEPVSQVFPSYVIYVLVLLIVLVLGFIIWKILSRKSRKK